MLLHNSLIHMLRTNCEMRDNIVMLDDVYTNTDRMQEAKDKARDKCKR